MSEKLKSSSYTAKDIEVLEGLEPVRKRPGMYIGGTDDNALHHLVSEIVDNSMDEIVAGYADEIRVFLDADNHIIISDNGRGIPIDPHPKYPNKSALEVILTTLHSGGKFSSKAYQTAGGLHGVGISVVNALSDDMQVKILRDGYIWQQKYSRGIAISSLEKIAMKDGMKNNINNEFFRVAEQNLLSDSKQKQGTIISFHPDEEIFGNLSFSARRIYELLKTKAYLFRGATIIWRTSCEEEGVPLEEIIHFPRGLEDYLNDTVQGVEILDNKIFTGSNVFEHGRVEWAVVWTSGLEQSSKSFCNTIPTPQGGTHENGMRAAIVKSIKNFAELLGNKKAGQITSDDIFDGAYLILSLFIRNPQFAGQTKEKLVTPEASRLVETALRDQFDHWLSDDPDFATRLLENIIYKMDERLSRKKEREIGRKTLIHKLRLPGKLADCSSNNPHNTEIFIVEGDSAGGSAKQARKRETQAVLPLKGKILNVANSGADKIKANQEISDLCVALGCGTGKNFDLKKLRYEKIIIMTDADIDGAHIASLLMAFFFLEMPDLIRHGHLYLARPPLYRISQAGKYYYSHSDEERDKIVAKLSKNRGNIEINRFKGLGEMTAQQLKETTMDPSSRNLLQIRLAEDIDSVSQQVDALMGKKPELRYQFIQEQALSKIDLLNEKLLDI